MSGGFRPLYQSPAAVDAIWHSIFLALADHAPAEAGRASAQANVRYGPLLCLLLQYHVVWGGGWFLFLFLVFWVFFDKSRTEQKRIETTTNQGYMSRIMYSSPSIKPWIQY